MNTVIALAWGVEEAAMISSIGWKGWDEEKKRMGLESNLYF